jgi:hypothetical protein
MLALRCTQKLLKRMKLKPVEAAASSTVLGDWYANTISLPRRRHAVILCAERSLLPLVVTAGSFSTLLVQFREGASTLLRDIGVDETGILQELDAMADLVVTKTDNRSVVGVMNDYVRLAAGRDEALRQLSLRLAETPIFASTPRTLWPIKATLELFVQAQHQIH